MIHSSIHPIIHLTVQSICGGILQWYSSSFKDIFRGPKSHRKLRKLLESQKRLHSPEMMSFSFAVAQRHIQVTVNSLTKLRIIIQMRIWMQWEFCFVLFFSCDSATWMNCEVGCVSCMSFLVCMPPVSRETQ